ncbi:MAG TPA: hypothetical protein VHO70_03030 [Chitinispirillaceae bacterium]|nr:hypothetical protein [Chitinispirillaceae bacterium]
MESNKSSSDSKSAKKFLGIHFRCCNVYSRIYTNNSGTAYEGQCPRCRKKVSIAIGKGGTSSRFF